MSATAQPALSSPKLILIVDDTPVNLGVISGALKDFYKTKVATNGERALALASADEKPDLILLDVMMPGMDGYEVCSRLKADPATCEIPVIFLTGQTSVEDETRGFEVGGVDYVHKPFSPAVVKARVRSHILLREARAQLAEQLHAINNELEVARQIQLSILPHSLPQLPGLDILPSALIASMLQVALTAQVGHSSEPAKVLRGLNRSLCGKFTHNFVTAAYVYVDLEKNLMRYAGAGHPPVLQFRNATGKAAQVLENGLILGMFEEATYEALELALEPGDRHILYTDGIVEAANPAKELYGTDRFMRFMESNKSLAADPFADALLAEITNWTGLSADQGQQDDITLLLFDFKRP